MKLGRFPLAASPYRVNYDTTSSAPSTSTTDRFILPSSSEKMRNPQTLSAIQAVVDWSSAWVKPTSSTSPLSMDPMTRSDTATDAVVTLCTSTRTTTPPDGTRA